MDDNHASANAVRDSTLAIRKEERDVERNNGERNNGDTAFSGQNLLF